MRQIIFRDEKRSGEMQPDTKREHKGTDHLRGLCPDQDRALGMSVSERASPDGKDHHRRGADRCGRAEENFRIRDFVDVPAHRGLLHPGANEGDQLPPEKEAIIAMAQRAKCCSPGDPADRQSVLASAEILGDARRFRGCHDENRIALLLISARVA